MTDDQAGRVVWVVRDELGVAVLGAYLFGSAVGVGLRPTSDIDVLVVTARATDPDERRRLLERLLPLSGRGDPSGQSRSVELTILVRDDIVPWRYPPNMDFQYGDWWRAEFEAGELSPWDSPNPDVAVLIEMVLTASRPLFGPPASELLDAVPPGDVRRAMIDGIPGLLADLDGDERNVVLTFARIWATLTTGEFLSKDRAADWAVARLPAAQRDVVAHARAIYLGETPEEWGELLAHVPDVVGRMHSAIVEAVREADPADPRGIE